MPSPRTESPRFIQLLERARAGCRESLGKLLEPARRVLRRKGFALLWEDVQAKISESDLVQDTFLQVQRDLASFQGQTHEEFLAWLCSVLRHNVEDAHRRFYGTQKRDVSRELSLDDPQAGKHLRDELREPAVPPDAQAMGQEDIVRLRAAIWRLSEDQQQVLQLRFGERLSFPEIADRLHTSPDAARMMSRRVVRCLAKRMKRTS
jgi:RNA polymerase sigma-70 factor (subfamily 1)